MNFAAVEKLAKAALYEGNLLYPYRSSSVKDRQRWNFGVLSPRSWAEIQTGADTCMSQTQCLAQNSILPAVEIRVRFLHLIARSVGRLARPEAEWPGEKSSQIDFEPVESLEVNGRIFRSGQEAEERQVSVRVQYGDTVDLGPARHDFTVIASRRMEPIRDAGGKAVGVIVRDRESVSLTVEAAMERCADDIFKITVRTFNRTRFDDPEKKTRDQALMCSLISAHTVMGAENCKFISLLEPPEELRDLALSCQNTGTWPVMVGHPEERDTILSSPVVLYDYPQTAPESEGDMFDATEIDKILSLRIMILSDDEKREMRETDERACRSLDRTGRMRLSDLRKLHGVVRSVRR